MKTMNLKGILILMGLLLISSIAMAQVKKEQQVKKELQVEKEQREKKVLREKKVKKMEKKTPLTSMELKEINEDLKKAATLNRLVIEPIHISIPAGLETKIDNWGKVTVTVIGGEMGREEKQKEAEELQKTLQKRQDFLNRWARGNCTEGRNTIDQIGAKGSWYYPFNNMEENGQQRPSDNRYRYPTQSELAQLCTDYYSFYVNNAGVWYGVTEEFTKSATLDNTNGCLFFPIGGMLLRGQPSEVGWAFYWSSDQFEGYWGSSDSQAAYELVHGTHYGAPEGYGIQLKVRFIRK